MNLNKILTILTLLILSSVTVSAITYDGSSYEFPRIDTTTNNNYQFSQQGRNGFDVRNYGFDNQQAYFTGNIFSEDFMRKFTNQQTLTNNAVAANYENNQNQGTTSYRKDFTESYGTCEPGEQTWNTNVVAKKIVYPQQKIQPNQRRGIIVTKVRASGCDGYRRTVVDSNVGSNTFNNQRLNAALAEDKNYVNVQDQLQQTFNQQSANFAAGKTTETANRDFYAPVVGSRLRYNRYY